MQKPLPRQTTRALNPPANVKEPYRFFESVLEHPLQPLDTALNLRTAWWMADAALLAYSDHHAATNAFAGAGLQAQLASFSGKSTQAYVASLPDAIVVAFRGTQLDNFFASVFDFLVDLTVFPAKDPKGHLVHGGFHAALEEVWTGLEQHLRDEQARRPRPLWVTGHSLGAALATLAAARCSERPALQLQGVYTFGSPRVASRAFGEALAVPVYRFRNDSDIVPHLPPPGLYEHLGRLQFIDGAGHLHRDVPPEGEEGLDLQGGFSLVEGALALGARAQRLTAFDLPLPGFIADHAPINYSIALWNCYDTEAT